MNTEREKKLVHIRNNAADLGGSSIFDHQQREYDSEVERYGEDGSESADLCLWMKNKS